MSSSECWTWPWHLCGNLTAPRGLLSKKFWLILEYGRRRAQGLVTSEVCRNSALQESSLPPYGIAIGSESDGWKADLQLSVDWLRGTLAAAGIEDEACAGGRKRCVPHLLHRRNDSSFLRAVQRR